MLDLTTNELILFTLLGLLAEIVGTVSGFGSSLFFVPIASKFFDFHTVLGLTAFFHVLSNSAKIYLFKKGVDRNITFNMGISSLSGVLLGAILTVYISTKNAPLVVTSTLLLLGIALLLFPRYTIQKTRPNLLIGGSISGFLAGFTGTGGAIRGIVLSAFGLEKNSFIATSALIDFGVDLTRFIVYLSMGYIVVMEMLWLLPFLLFMSILGTYLGKLLVNRINEAQFRKLVLITVISVALIEFVRFLPIFN